MTKEDTKKAIAIARSQAEALAAAYIKRAATSDASESEKALAEAARIILETSELSTELIEREAVERRMAEVSAKI